MLSEQWADHVENCQVNCVEKIYIIVLLTGSRTTDMSLYKEAHMISYLWVYKCIFFSILFFIYYFKAK